MISETIPTDTESILMCVEGFMDKRGNILEQAQNASKLRLELEKKAVLAIQSSEGSFDELVT